MAQEISSVLTGARPSGNRRLYGLFRNPEGAMDIAELDKDLLELTVLEVPWDMVCAEFHERYGSPGNLARRLFELANAGLVTIRRKRADLPPPSPYALEADALANACFADLELVGESSWVIIATATGFALVENRLAEQ